METIQFLVQGSATEPYKVTFQREGKILSAFCTCPAGASGQYCKHRLSILQGRPTGVISDNVAEGRTVAAWLPGTNVEAAMEALFAAERDLERAKSAAAAARKDLARTMRSEISHAGSPSFPVGPDRVTPRCPAPRHASNCGSAGQA
jgi:hypothetical protein